MLCRMKGKRNLPVVFSLSIFHTKIACLHFFEISQMGPNRHLACLFLIPHLTAVAHILSLRKKQRCFLQGSLVSLWSWLISQRRFCFSWTTAHLSALIGWNCDFKKPILPSTSVICIWKCLTLTWLPTLNQQNERAAVLAELLLVNSRFKNFNYKIQHALQWSKI